MLINDPEDNQMRLNESELRDIRARRSDKGTFLQPDVSRSLPDKTRTETAIVSSASLPSPKKASQPVVVTQDEQRLELQQLEERNLLLVSMARRDGGAFLLMLSVAGLVSVLPFAHTVFWGCSIAASSVIYFIVAMHFALQQRKEFNKKCVLRAQSLKELIEPSKPSKKEEPEPSRKNPELPPSKLQVIAGTGSMPPCGSARGRRHREGCRWSVPTCSLLHRGSV